MAKYKVIHTCFEDKYSAVVVRYKGRNYLGTATFDNNDAEEYPVSSFLGCRIAEKKAVIKALRFELRKKQREYKIILEFFERTKSLPIAFRSQKKELAHMARDIGRRKRIINNIEKSIQTDIDNYIAFHEKRKASKE